MSCPARVESGFTAIEALIVVLIVVLCAGLASVGMKRWLARARTAEAVSMLSEIGSKEQAFKAGGGRFLALRPDARVAGAPPDEAAAGFYPLAADSPALASIRTPTRADDPARWPAGWRTIGLRPRSGLLYCTYLVNAGDGPVPANLRFGSALLAGAPSGPWFYALAACNLAGRPGYPDDVTVFGVSSVSGAVRTFNDGR